MTLRQKRQKTDEPTRERILRHAIARFSTQSYESTGLREIAADAGVDVALVHRSFGSKEQLFAECVRSCVCAESMIDPGPDTLSRLFVDVVSPRSEGEVRPTDIMVHSFSSPEASRVLREVGTEMMLDPVTRASRHGSAIKTALCLSTLMGFAIMRDVIGVEALTKADPVAVSLLLGKAIDALDHD